MLIKKFPQTNLMQKQVYAYWVQLHKGTWRLHDDQVQLTLLVLQCMDNLDIEIISVLEEDGISSLAFNFKSTLEDYGEEIIEIGMDSTCKKSLVLLSEMLTETPGQGKQMGLVMSYMVLLEKQMARHCHWHLCSPVPPMAQPHPAPKIICCKKFFSTWITTAQTLQPYILTELSAFCTVFPHARGQLCYWHAIRYLEQWLAEDKPPAKYDLQIANKSFTFIDLTWAPGVMSGWLEDNVHKDDVECERLDNENEQPAMVCKSYIPLPSLITHEPCPATINLSTASTCVDNCRGYTHSSMASTSKNKQG